MGKPVSITLDDLNKLNVDEFKEIELGEMLYYTLPKELNNRFIVSTCIYILKKTLFYENDFYACGEPHTLFLFSNSYAYRKDLLETFDNVMQVSKNYVRMLGMSSKKLHLSFFKHLSKLLIWNKQIKRNIPSVLERIFILRQLYGIYIDYQEYKTFINQNKCNIDKLVTLCDVHAVDYFFTEKFNSCEYETITLQHGVFSSTANGRAYGKSKSKYFLANSQFAVDEAILSGHSMDGLYAAGLPSFVGRDIEKKNKSLCNEKLGAILEGEYCHDDNKLLISMLQDFCKKNNKELYIKLHPVSEKKAYDDVIDYDFVKAVYGKEKGILEFAELIDIAIIRNTTSLLELINKGIPCFIYVSENQKMDVYKNVEMLRFSSENELKTYLDNVVLDSFLEEFKEMKKYFGDGDLAGENYRKIFKELGVL